MFEKLKSEYTKNFAMVKSVLTSKFASDESAVTQIAINGVTGIVAVVITLLIGVLIISKLSPKIVGTDNATNDTIDSVVSSGLGALDIATIIPYVIVAGIAILILLLYFGGGGKRMQ